MECRPRLHRSALFVFFLTGLINYWLARTGSRPSWFVFATATIDIALLTFLIVTPNPFADYNHLRRWACARPASNIC